MSEDDSVIAINSIVALDEGLTGVAILAGKAWKEAVRNGLDRGGADGIAAIQVSADGVRFISNREFHVDPGEVSPDAADETKRTLTAAGEQCEKAIYGQSLPPGRIMKWRGPVLYSEDPNTPQYVYGMPAAPKYEEAAKKAAPEYDPLKYPDHVPWRVLERRGSVVAPQGSEVFNDPARAELVKTGTPTKPKKLYYDFATGKLR